MLHDKLDVLSENGSIDLQNSIEDHRNLIFIESFLKNSLLILLIGFYTAPLCYLFWRALSGIKRNNLKSIKISLFLFRFIHIIGYPIISIAFAYIASQVNIFFTWFIIFSIFYSLYFWFKLMRSILNGFKSAIKIHYNNEISLSFSNKDYTFIKTVFSPYKWVKLQQNNLPIRWGSTVLLFVSNIIYFFSVFVVFLSPILLLGNVVRWQTNYSLYYDYSEPAEIAYEIILLELPSIISAVIFIPLFAALLNQIATFFRNLSTLLNRKTIENYRQLDKRKPIVFLRAFKEKKVKFSKSKNPMLYRGFIQENRIKNLDDLLFTKFWDIAPVYSFANPQGESNRTGAIKQKIDNSNDVIWKDEIFKLMNNSLAICMSVEETKSLKDEIDIIKKHNFLSKTLFIFRNKLDISFLNNFDNLNDNQKKQISSGKAKALFYSSGKPIILVCEENDPITYFYILTLFFRREDK